MKFLVLILISSVSLNASAGLKAYYEVPTSNPELAASTKFKVSDLSLTPESDGETTLRYTVPVELTGIPNEIDFTGPLTADGGSMQSEYGNLNCLSNKKEMMCSVSYSTLKLKFDNDMAKIKIGEKFKNDEALRRAAVQEKFSTDPIGIIHIMFKK